METGLENLCQIHDLKYNIKFNKVLYIYMIIVETLVDKV